MEGISCGHQPGIKRLDPQKQATHNLSSQVCDETHALRDRLSLEAAYFEARYHHNAIAARGWFKRTKGQTCLLLPASFVVLIDKGVRNFLKFFI